MTAISIERNVEKFNSLPHDYQEAIRTSDYDGNLSLITKEYKLHIDQSAILEVLLAKLIFGEIKSQDIISEIGSKLHIENEEAKNITNSLNDMIIKPIKENIKNIQTSVDTKGDEE
jgi:TRAP-type mannitol/chloroaromatic compound transport system substrate-binding protein